MKKIFAIIVSAAVFLSAALYAQESGDKNEKTKAKKVTITVGGVTMLLDQAIDIVLEQNLTLRSAKYDVVMSDSGYEKLQKKYSPTINLEGGYTKSYFPSTGGLSVYDGKPQMYQYDATASISKYFSTGTTVSTGVKETYTDVNDSRISFMSMTIPSQPAYHKPGFFVNLQQELLKNSFGYQDRLMDKIQKNSAELQKQFLVSQLSGLVVGVISDYWNVTVRKAALQNSQLELESTRRVRNIIARNAQYGLAEAYDLNQYNALTAAAEMKLEIARQAYSEAVRKLVQALNMPADTQITGITDLVDDLPQIKDDDSVSAAFKKRVDYRNAEIGLENAKMELKMYENSDMPSLTFNLGVSTQGQDNSFSTAAGDASTATYPTIQARVKMSYPLDDTEQKTNLRNAKYKVKQSQILLDKTKQEIRDDVLNRIERVRMQHTVLEKTKLARLESDRYYQNILVKFQQGKVNSVTMKLATDSMIQSRQQELEMLVNYNLALLQYDLSKNEIFEKYNVDVEKYLKKVKE